MAGGQVVVIGAGIAGLVTAKVMRDDGFDVTVLEQEPTVGGVWAPSRTYPGLRTNNSRETYAFSDHPYGDSGEVFPTAEQVRQYLDSYVDRFELAPLLRLSTTVSRIVRRDDGFEIEVQGTVGREQLRCDFVVIATGTYSKPNVPDFPGASNFVGVVVHSSQALDPALITGKRVAVVGAGKSALDCAVWAARTAAQCTLVFRTPHWMAPRYLPDGTPADQAFLGRVTELFLPYHRRTRLERFLQGRWLAWVLWPVMGLLIRRLLRMPAPMIPDERLPHGLENAGLAPEFYELARGGRIGLRRSAKTAFGEDHLILADGEELPADVVIFATGWRQEFPFLDQELRSEILPDSRFHLYRHILPPAEQRLGFIGYSSSTACQLTSEIAAHWLAQHFRGELAVPAVPEMRTEIDRVHTWLAATYPARSDGYYLGMHVIHYIDELLTDMGVPARRTGSVWEEYFGTFSPSRYREVGEQRRSASAARASRWRSTE
ncbi:NAD(P)-binding domain-containing protein [Nocardia yamanashiensis]|uniref:flavin-containing monooxygenase n=1 Tax=Nocardia yamanashiensis TaxID=209247 RepID=UPI001E41546E|nr:NAD(P)-binding domain-containing protein [Nocardia yamanashiensis]UGT43775.1 NAD(P)-binding domain-containing protein [Nocardia yamanashiensis]